MARNGFALNKAEGKVMGVCAGLADYLDVDVLWVRVATVLLTVTIAHALVLVYFAVGLLAAKRPAIGWDDEYPIERRWRRRERNAASELGGLGDLDARVSAMERSARSRGE